MSAPIETYARVRVVIGLVAVVAALESVENGFCPGPAPAGSKFKNCAAAGGTTIRVLLAAIGGCAVQISGLVKS
jgi:hypothetical protein